MAFGGAWFVKTSPFRKRPGHCPRHQRLNGTGERKSPGVGCMGKIKWSKLLPPPQPPLPIGRRRDLKFFIVGEASSSSSSSSPETFHSGGKSITKAAGIRDLAVEEMDPPLPVVEKKGQRSPAAASLWKRRCLNRDELSEIEICWPVRLLKFQAAVNSGVV
ncbi:hypothetical protein KSP40_PGU018641 [Platanthera guangdongensis]|uniref:Uncharacterized protein n=1 Tax=Platanthera guangdongensis TaxID=2320717 RepID=A0ABR2LI35_9ASPA